MTAILNPPTDIKLTIASEHVEQVLLCLIQMKASFSVQYVDKDETESISTTQPLAYASLKRNNFGVNELDAIIEKALRSNKIPSSADIAEELGMKPTVFKAWFRKQYDKPFYQYYVEKKMAYASELLKEGKEQRLFQNYSATHIPSNSIKCSRSILELRLRSIN